MGVLDKFLDIMKLNDDYDDDDDYLDDDYEDDYEDEKPHKNKLFGKSKKYSDYDDDFDRAEAPAPRAKAAKPSASTSATSYNKVTPMKPASHSRSGGSGMGVCVIKPSSVEDGREICSTLLDGRTVILNLEGLDLEVAQRIIDFTSGAAFAIDGNLQKISSFIFLVTPLNVDISGDLQDLLGNAFDVSSIRTRF